MKCVICKTGEVRSASVQAEIKVDCDRLLVPVEGELCPECGEAYYPAEVLRTLERIRDEFARRTIAASPVGRVYRVT